MKVNLSAEMKRDLIRNDEEVQLKYIKLLVKLLRNSPSETLLKDVAAASNIDEFIALLPTQEVDKSSVATFVTILAQEILLNTSEILEVEWDEAFFTKIFKDFPAYSMDTWQKVFQTTDYNILVDSFTDRKQSKLRDFPYFKRLALLFSFAIVASNLEEVTAAGYSTLVAIQTLYDEVLAPPTKEELELISFINAHTTPTVINRGYKAFRFFYRTLLSDKELTSGNEARLELLLNKARNDAGFSLALLLVPSMTVLKSIEAEYGGVTPPILDEITQVLFTAGYFIESEMSSVREGLGVLMGETEGDPALTLPVATAVLDYIYGENSFMELGVSFDILKLKLYS